MGLATLVSGGAARAQIAGSVALESDYRLRGYSLSEGRPAATLQLGYDDATGVYANLAASALVDEGAPRLLGTQVNLGYARRIAPESFIELGLLRADYRRAEPGDRRRNYTEAYVGLGGRRLSARLFYSRDYFRNGVSAAYGELNGVVEPAADWRLEAHVGTLVYLGDARPYPWSRSADHDWRLSLARQWPNLEIHAAVSGGGPGGDYYRGRRRDRTAFTLGASIPF